MCFACERKRSQGEKVGVNKTSRSGSFEMEDIRGDGAKPFLPNIDEGGEEKGEEKGNDGEEGEEAAGHGRPERGRGETPAGGEGEKRKKNRRQAREAGEALMRGLRRGSDWKSNVTRVQRVERESLLCHHVLVFERRRGSPPG